MFLEHVIALILLTRFLLNICEDSIDKITKSICLFLADAARQLNS